MEQCFIGVDLGTSAVKLLLMDASGEVLRTVSRTYPISFPKPGWSEQNPEDWGRESLAGLKELSAGFESRIAGIGFGGQMHGLVALDESDRVIRPAILWNDGRTAQACTYLNETVGRDVLSEETGNIAFAGFTAPKLLWMKEHEPENFARIAKIMLPKDYLAYRLSGTFATDPSDASGMLLFDVKNRTWSEKMCGICDVKESQLAKIYESHEVIGTILPSVAGELSLPKDVKIIIGAGDNAAAAVGTGTVAHGDCNISLGTSGTVFIASDTYMVDDANALHSCAHATGAYHLMGCMLSAASCNKWWMEEIARDKDFAGEQSKMEDLGRNDVYFLPYLMGERSPHNNPDARGVFFGMRMDTDRTAMSQAVLEGVAFGLRDSLEVARAGGITVTRSKICGGGAVSPVWRRMIANIMGLVVEIPTIEEGPSYGAAILAACGCGTFASVKDAASRLVTVTETLAPEPELTERYEERYRAWKKIYPALKDLF